MNSIIKKYNVPIVSNILTLMFVCIILLCAALFDKINVNGKILDYSCTLLSIVLSIVAILYTFISSLNTDKLNNDTSKSVAVIEQSVKSLDSHFSNSIKYIIEIKSEISKLKDKLDNSNVHVENVDLTGLNNSGDI